MRRDDDIILYAGYRIGPFEVESTLLEHPAVAESAVVGKPDAERGEIVKAFVVLRSTYAPSAELASELQHHVRQRLSSHAYPREAADKDYGLTVLSDCCVNNGEEVQQVLLTKVFPRQADVITSEQWCAAIREK